MWPILIAALSLTAVAYAALTRRSAVDRPSPDKPDDSDSRGEPDATDFQVDEDADETSDEPDVTEDASDEPDTPDVVDVDAEKRTARRARIPKIAQPPKD
jgi:hypothetical protein